MKKIILIVILSILIFKVNASDTLKVNIYWSVNFNTVFTKPTFYDVTGIDYYTDKTSIGEGISSDFSYFFHKNIGIEAGLGLQSIPTKILLESPENRKYKIISINSIDRSIIIDNYFTIGPTLKFKLLKKIYFNFNSSLLFSYKNKKGQSLYSSCTSYDGKLIYTSISYKFINPFRTDLLIKPSIIYTFNSCISLKFNFIARLSTKNFIEGSYYAFPDYPEIASTGKIEQKTNYTGFSIGLEINLTSLKNRKNK